MEVVKQRTENQLMNDCKMKRDFKEKRDQKEMHKLALRMVISEDPELRALVEIQNLEVLEKAEILNELRMSMSSLSTELYNNIFSNKKFLKSSIHLFSSE